MIAFLIRALELLFVVGCFGSLIVIILAGIEDVETVFASGEEEPSAPAPSQAAPQ